MHLPLVPDEATILYAVIPPFVGRPEELKEIAAAMFETMERGSGGIHGIGLAAPQVGLPIRMFVMQPDKKGRKYVCINPKFLPLGDVQTVDYEGCLTRPGQRTLVRRHERILAEWVDLHGQWCVTTLFGYQARCFQHERDHLDGICIWTKPLDGEGIAA